MSQGAIKSGDVKGRKNSPAALRPDEGELARARLSEIEAYYDTAPVGLCVLDTELRYVRINERLAEINGIPVSEHLGRTIREVLPELADQAEPWLRDVLETGDPLRDVEITVETHGDEKGERTRLENWYPMRNEAGEVCGINIVVEDLTERKRVEEQLAELNIELEARVDERTQKLKTANRELRQEIVERRRLEAEIVAITERVQSRIGQDLHDDLGQQLSALGMLASAIERDLRRDAHPKAESVSRLTAMIKQAIDTTRGLAKGLYPIELEKGGFIVAIEELARVTQAFSGVECIVRGKATFPLGESAAIHLYRIAQEAVNNALKHAAPRQIIIDCTTITGVPTLTITNDGLPFRKPRSRRHGLGLHILEYRAGLLGAEITISPGPDGGCKLACSLAQHARKQTD